MISSYNVSICREDKMLILNLNSKRFGHNTWQAYSLTAWRSPEIQEVCAQKGITKNGFIAIACAMACVSFDHGCLVVGGNPMMVSTLFLIEPDRLAVVIDAINRELGNGWSYSLDGLTDEQISTMTAAINILCEPYIETVYQEHLAVGRVMGIEEAAKRVAENPPALYKGCIWLIVAIIGLIIFFSCRG
jgi:hypothetical protein